MRQGFPNLASFGTHLASGFLILNYSKVQTCLEFNSFLGKEFLEKSYKKTIFVEERNEIPEEKGGKNRRGWRKSKGRRRGFSPAKVLSFKLELNLLWLKDPAKGDFKPE